MLPVSVFSYIILQSIGVSAPHTPLQHCMYGCLKLNEQQYNKHIQMQEGALW